jgi:transposase InsO family protein
VHGRAELVRRVIEQGRPVAHLVVELNISRATGYKWLARWRAEGPTGLVDRPSRAHRLLHTTPAETEQQVLALRTGRKLGPARIGPLVGLAPSTVHAVLTRHGPHRLAWLDRPTGQLVRRYEQLAGRRVGYDFVHCAIDDHTRLAYAEIYPDETATTCAGFLRAAAAWFATVGIDRIERVMTDNAMAYRKSHAWRQALTDLGAQARFTRSYRPQTNGKAERFNRTLAEEWAYIRPFHNSADRAAALPGWLHTYNHHRSHTALGGQPPISRTTVSNGAGHYS